MSERLSLSELGSELRRRRRALDWTQQQLAEKARLSPRFVGDVERGRANLSLAALGQLAAALDCNPLDLLRPPAGDRRGQILQKLRQLPEGELPRVLRFLDQCLARRTEERHFALVGLRGAGKSSVGRALARSTGARFLELDQRIEELAGLPLSELFEYHGEQHYRELERQALDSLSQETEPLVLATGGSLVTDAANWETLRRRFVTCWLRTDPQQHFERVRRQGDLRPMAGDPRAMDKLRAILREREPLYALAHHTVETSHRDLEQVFREVEALAWPVLSGV